MQIVKVSYNKGINSGFFIKHRRGYIPIFFDERTFAQLNNVVGEKEVELDLDGSVTHQ